MAFWNRKPKTDGTDYFVYARKHLNKVMDTMEDIERQLTIFNDPKSVTVFRPRVVKAIEEMRGLHLPANYTDLAEKHKQGYLQIMTLQLRKIDDLLNNNGHELEALIAEEEALVLAAQEEAAQAIAETDEMYRRLGISRQEWD